MDQQKKKTKQAAALSYDAEKSSAPVMVAMGSGKMAERIIETAEQHDIPVVPDENLADMLSQLSVGDEIPPELYSIVAEILVFVSSVDQDFSKRNKLFS